MKIILNDKTLFGNEAAEDEVEDIFTGYAVERPEVSKFLDQTSSLAIARAYKGEGKSALLRLVALRLRSLQNRVLTSVHPKIVGVMGNPSTAEVAHFLFQIGFLTARRDCGNNTYEHISYAENPTLLNAKSNIDQGFSWEVHPVFRQALKLKNV